MNDAKRERNQKLRPTKDTVANPAQPQGDAQQDATIFAQLRNLLKIFDLILVFGGKSKAGHRLPTAHALARYRCFLPDLAGLAGLHRAGPMPDQEDSSKDFFILQNPRPTCVPACR